MPTSITSRYQATYRQEEIGLIVRFAMRGESLGFVGLAGVGKSNIVQFLREIEEHAAPIGSSVARLHFPIVEATYWQQSPLSLWKIMLDALDQATQDLTPPPPPADKVIPISEEERVLNTLRSRLHWICQELKHQVMFVLDDFDAVFEIGPLSMLERLSGLRSEGNREALSYLIFTKRLPHVLGQSHNLENESKFYDLFRHHIYALEPYAPEDAFHMLKHLNEVAGNPLRERDLAQIRQLAGGHPQLLKIVFDLWVNEGLSGANPIAWAEQSDVQQECHRILRGLHEDEQAVLLRVAQDGATDVDQEIIDHLVRRGVLAPDTKKLFSPLLDQFLSSYEG